MQVVPKYTDRLIDGGPNCLRDLRLMDPVMRAAAFAQIQEAYSGIPDGRVPDLFDFGHPGDPYAIAFGILDGDLKLLGVGLVYQVQLVTLSTAESTASIEGKMLVSAPDAIRDELFDAGKDPGFDVTTEGNPATVHITITGGFPA